MEQENSAETRVSPFQSPLFIVGTIFVALLIGLGIWIGVTGPGNEPAAQTPTVSETETESVTPDPEQEISEPERSPGVDIPAHTDSVCGLLPGDTSVPFDDVDSVPVAVGQRLTVPGGDGVGPGITDGISRCYAHSPTGAILAAANFITWTSSQQQLDQSSRALILEDSRSKTMITQAIEDWDGSSGSPFLIHGYVYDYQGEDDALVILAVSMFDHPGKYIGFPVPLTWAEGDWKVVVPATYAWGEHAITDFEHEGYIRWEPTDG